MEDMFRFSEFERHDDLSVWKVSEETKMSRDSWYWFGSTIQKVSNLREALKDSSEHLGVSLSWLLNRFQDVADRATQGDASANFYTLTWKYWVDGTVDFHNFKRARCPRDGRPGRSFVDCLEKQGCAAKATHYLSWAWNYKVTDFVSALREWAEDKTDEERGNIFIWICFFCNNQVRIIMENEQPGSAGLSRIFQSRLENIGKMLIMIDKFENPEYATRAWCVYETFVAHKTKVDCEAILPAASAQELAASGLSLPEIASLIRRIDVENSEASDPRDKDAIKEQIRANSSFASVNDAVHDLLSASLGKITLRWCIRQERMQQRRR